MSLGFSDGDVRRVAQVCSAFRIGDSTPPYLQRYLKARLRPTDPVPAERVGTLEPGEMNELWRRARALQGDREQV